MKTIAVLLLAVALSVSACASAAKSRIDEAVAAGIAASQPILDRAANALPNLSFENQQYAENQQATLRFCALTTQYLSTVNAYAIRQGLPGYADEGKTWAKVRHQAEKDLGQFGGAELSRLVKGWGDALMGNPHRDDPRAFADKLNQACLMQFWHPQTGI